ncbi:hypothetical protein [Bacillus sp. 123MFChir2]|uniref:hypothetical protein n=1 Tax=Bacillus sp. 123MFChir2 TaxID=1169144 RepID=UPI000377F98A|nr:hypothetical protein [Bacillus sp. 123MFChir2]
MARIVIFIVIALSLISCTKQEKVSFGDLHSKTDIKSIEIRKGNGNHVIVKEQSEIQDILSNYSNMELKPVNIKDKIKGYQYTLKIINVDGKISTVIISGNNLSVDGMDYENQEEVKTESLQKYFQ